MREMVLMDNKGKLLLWETTVMGIIKWEMFSMGNIMGKYWEESIVTEKYQRLLSLLTTSGKRLLCEILCHIYV